MTTIQDRILEKFREQFDRFPDDYYNGIVGKDGSRFSNTLSGLEELEEFILTSIKEVEEETRKETIDKYFLDAEKRLSITNKEKQNE